jgi:nucleoside-diphosphate-sugar epimerase
MKVLVTGSQGFIGGHLARSFERAGHEVCGLDIADSDMDARDYFRHNSERFDAVIHAAAVVGGRRVIEWTPLNHAQNLEIDAALFAWAARTKPGRVVYFSSSCAYPVSLAHGKRQLREDDINLRHPEWPDELYGWTKLTGEVVAQTAQAAGVPVSVVRPFSVYGPGMREGFAVRGFLEQVQKRADPIQVWGDAGQVRDFIHVSDVCKAVLMIAGMGIDGPVNLGTGRATSLHELATMMGKAAGYAPGIKVDSSMPAGVPRLVADPARLHEFYTPGVTLEDYLTEVLGGSRNG